MQLALIIPVDGSGVTLPNQGLPGGAPARPGHDLPGGGGHPDQTLPGSGAPPMASHPIALPPGQAFPPGINPPIVPPDPPPGSVWPPITDAPPGKAVIVVAVPGYGVRYVVVNLAQPK